MLKTWMKTRHKSSHKISNSFWHIHNSCGHHPEWNKDYLEWIFVVRRHEVVVNLYRQESVRASQRAAAVAVSKRKNCLSMTYFGAAAWASAEQQRLQSWMRHWLPIWNWKCCRDHHRRYLKDLDSSQKHSNVSHYLELNLTPPHCLPEGYPCQVHPSQQQLPLQSKMIQSTLWLSSAYLNTCDSMMKCSYMIVHSFTAVETNLS